MTTVTTNPHQVAVEEYNEWRRDFQMQKTASKSTAWYLAKMKDAQHRIMGESVGCRLPIACWKKDRTMNN